jgi:TolA-binding protein
MSDPIELSVEELQAKLGESEAKLQALERTKTGLLTDLQKRKGVERLVRAAGIDLSSENVEDQIAELLVAKAAPVAPVPPLAAPVAPVTASGETQAVATPSTAVEEAMRAQLASMQKQMDRLNDKLQQTEKEKQQERKARLDEFKRSIVMQELEKAGCKRPAHVYALQGNQFRLLDDNETVVYGSEESPVNVSDAVSNLEKDDEYSIYFPGVVASGSGLPTSRSSMPVNDNPFTKSGANATKAAEIINRDKSYAQRLVQQARARGDVDPILARAVGY